MNASGGAVMPCGWAGGPLRDDMLWQGREQTLVYPDSEGF